MNEHLGSLLDAYLDEALSASRRAAARAHLDCCADCRQEMEARKRISAGLRKAPAMRTRKSEQRFVSEVILRLSCKTQAPANTNGGYSVGGLMVPVGLLFGLIGLQAIAVVTALVAIIPGLRETLWRVADFAPAIIQLPDAARERMAWVVSLGLPGGGFLFGWVIVPALMILYLGWFAGWWADHQAAGAVQ